MRRQSRPNRHQSQSQIAPPLLADSHPLWRTWRHGKSSRCQPSIPFRPDVAHSLAAATQAASAPQGAPLAPPAPAILPSCRGNEISKDCPIPLAVQEISLIPSRWHEP
eukprot:6213877-Pleurochrysis_carterae.AAC.1